MENVTQADIDAAHNLTDSFEYKRLLALREQQRVEVLSVNTAGCLLRDVASYGATSITPLRCPVENCDAKFNQNTLEVTNTSNCANPPPGFGYKFSGSDLNSQ